MSKLTEVLETANVGAGFVDDGSQFAVDAIMELEMTKEAAKVDCPFNVKDEVKIDPKKLTKYKHIKRIKEKNPKTGLYLKKSKVGRVIQTSDNGIALVDFWDTEPVRAKVLIEDLILVSKASEREDVSVKDDVVEVSVGDSHEAVAKPSRYNQGTIEVWDAIHGMGMDFNQGSVTKYLARYKYKHGLQDLHKSLNFLIKIIAIETKQDYYEVRKKSIEEIVG